MTFMVASMATGQRCSTGRTAVEERRVGIDMARHFERMLAARNCALDHDTALGLFRVLILPAWQPVDAMTARQLDIDFRNHDVALLVTLSTTLVLTVVVASFLHSVAWLRAVNCLVETIGMTLVHT
jgi:hypothetical protein